MCMPNILPDSFVVQRSVPVHGIAQLGFRSDPTGTVTHKALTTTLIFTMSDRPVYSTVSIRPFSSCHPTQAVAGPIVSHIRNPFLSSETPLSTLGWGAHIENSLISGVWTRSEHRLNVLELQAVMLGLSFTGPPSYDRYRQYQCETHPHNLLRLVGDLFLWLRSQDIAIRARHIPGCLNVITDQLSRLNQPITTE